MGSQMNKYLGDHIYGTYQPQQSSPEELPSYMIEVKLSLKRNIKQGWFYDLNNDLQRNNMSVSVDRNNIIVTGIPPEDDFNQQNVLEIVKGHDSGAQIISSRELHM